MENHAPQTIAEPKVQIPDEMDKVIKTLPKDKQAVLVSRRVSNHLSAWRPYCVGIGKEPQRKR